MNRGLVLAPAVAPGRDAELVASLAHHGIDALVLPAGGGPRWAVLAQALQALGDRAAQYAHLWWPDAGVQAAPETVARLFAVCDDLALDLAQPAYAGSPAGTPPSAWQHSAFQVRFTDGVDLRAPVLSQALLQAVWPTLAGLAADARPDWAARCAPGRVAVVDATPVAVAASAEGAGDAAARNLGGLLDEGDTVCLGAPGDAADALLHALMRSAERWTMAPQCYARYLAQHLAQPGDATLPVALNAALGGVGLRFGVAPAAAAHGPTPPPPPPASPALRDPVLLAADLDDLRQRHAAVVADRDRLAALLQTLADAPAGTAASARATWP